MNNKQIEDLVDLMFNTDMEEVMKEKSILEYIHKLQQENKELKRMCELYSKSLYNADLTKANQKIDKAIDMLDLIIPELWNISNTMTYKIKEVKRILGDKENE